VSGEVGEVHYCGIDLHARMMYLCVMDAQGTVRLSRNME